MSAETKIQHSQNTSTERLIIPVLSTSYPYPTNGEMHVNSTANRLVSYKNYSLGANCIHFYYLKQKINILEHIFNQYAIMCLLS